MNCDNCRWFNKTGFVPGFGDCALNREVHSANHEACEHYEEYEQRPHGEWTVRQDTMYHFECPFCKYLHQYKDNFCPLCGADLRNEGESE